jgi:hypothetical protein
MDLSRGPIRPRPPVRRSRGSFVRARLFATLLAVLVLPFAIFNFRVADQVRREIDGRDRAKSQAVAGLAAEAVDAHFDGLLIYVEGFATRPSLRAALERKDGTEVRALLRELVEKNRNLGRAFITDPEGLERYDWPPDESVIGKSFAFRDWYKGVRAAKSAYVSEIYERAAAPKCDVVALAVPLQGGNDLAGYLSRSTRSIP